ncbi:MAG TPA: hypothetical protein VLD86_12190, partial [Ilumatobacteraceae bacterium]|nr:hypothetical protein [Ilumatobacteraceae bacterium]
MRRSVLLAGTASVVLASGAAPAAPAQAAPVGYSVVIVAHTALGPEPSDFDSNLQGCETGTVVDGGGGAHFTPWGG